MANSEGQYILYALKGVNRLLYARVTKMKDDNHIDIELRNNGRVTLIATNDSNRVQVLPNSLRPAAQRALECDDVERILKVLETVLGVEATVVSAAAPGLVGGAALMSGLTAIGGSAVGGILVTAGVPAALAGNTLRKIIKRHENNTASNNAAVVGMMAGGVIGGVATVRSVAVAGSVVGLSGPGITSGLAGLGGGALSAGGLGMVGGLMACSGIFAVPVIGFGYMAWGLVASANEADLQRKYNAFCQRWHNQNYQGPP